MKTLCGLPRRTLNICERRILERRIDSLLFAALGHQEAGAQPGAKVYRILYLEGARLATEFQLRTKMDPELLHAELPSLHRLETLAKPEQPIYRTLD
jgi:hypothetical protein